MVHRKINLRWAIVLAIVIYPSLSSSISHGATIKGVIHYNGTQQGTVWVTALSQLDTNSIVAQTSLSAPGAYSLTCPPGSYYIGTQLDLDGSGSPAFENPLEPNDLYNGTGTEGMIALGDETLEGIDLYLSEIKQGCLLNTGYTTDFDDPYPMDMGYYSGFLWICVLAMGNQESDLYKVIPSNGQRVESINLGISYVTSIEWIGNDLWVCYKGNTSWKLKKYSYDGTSFTPGSEISLPSSTDWDTIWNINIAWDGNLMWVQEKGEHAKIYKINLTSGSIVQTITSEAFNKGQLGLGDISDICFSNGSLWGMDDDNPRIAQIDPITFEQHLTYFSVDQQFFGEEGKYDGMVNTGEEVYFFQSNREGPFKIYVGSLCNNSETQRAALMALYNSTAGDGWANNGGWKTPPLHTDGFAMPGTEGSWHGVVVSGGAVTGLNLDSNRLSGSIPVELMNLENLSSLSLCNNRLYATDSELRAFLNNLTPGWENCQLSLDGGYDVTSSLWAKAVLEVPGAPVTLKWKLVGADVTPSGDQVISGYFYADPSDFAYGSQYNPEVFVKIYIAQSGWCNIAFNHVTVDNVTVYSAHKYAGTAQQTGSAMLTNRLVEHLYNGVAIENTPRANGTLASGSTDSGYIMTSGLWAKAILQPSSGPVTLIWKEVGSDTTPSGDKVVSGYFYADPGDFAYGSEFNPEVFVKIYIAKSGWCNIAFNHVTVDNVSIFSAHNYAGNPNQSGTASLNNRLVENSYSGVNVAGDDMDYYPLEIGYSWSYTPSYGEQGDRVDTIIGKETVGGAETYIWNWQEAPDDNYNEKRWLAKNGTDLKLYKFGSNDEVDPPVTLSPPLTIF